MKILITVATLTLLSMTGLSQVTAQNTPPAMEAKAKEMVDAEVKKVDKDTGKVTLKHAEIKSLDMPAMTMVFRVKDAALWEKLVEGAKVKVSIEKALMGYNVTQVELIKN